MTADSDLLTRFATSRDAEAFAALTVRYLPLVYAAARRRTGDPALAEDVCQAMFLVLAKKAGRLDGRGPLADWLLTVTRYAGANAVRQRARRAKHEAAAARPEVALRPPDSIEADENAAVLSAHLDDALAGLSSVDRQAVLLRYYESADFAVVGERLNVSETAARRRVARAVDKLRSAFSRRGVSVSTAAIAAALPATLAVEPPAALAASIPALATSTSVAATPAAALAKGTIKTMLMTKIKAVAAATLTLLAVAGTGTGIGYLALAAAPATQLVALKPITGWLKIESYRKPFGGDDAVYYVEPATNRRVIMNSADGARVEEFVDPVAGIAGRYLPQINQFVIGNGDDGHKIDVPYTDEQMLAQLGRIPSMDRITRRPAANGERVVEIIPKYGMSGIPAMPEVLELHADADTGLIRRMAALPSKDGTRKGFDAIVVTRVPGPPVPFDAPEKLPLPAGATLVDNRPTPEVRDLLQKLDDVVSGGPGFEVGAIVQRNADVYSGEFEDDSADITICAGTSARYVIATWTVGQTSGRYDGEPQFIPKPAGWPKPTLEAVIAAVGTTRPNRFVVYDGATCWTSNDTVSGRRDPSGRTESDNHTGFWRNLSIAGRLWGRFPTRGSLFTKYELLQTPEGGHRVTLQATLGDYFTFSPATRPAIHPNGTIRMTIWRDLGPYPVRIEVIDDGANRLALKRGITRDVTDIGLPKAMYRDPVRVPEHWRRMHLDDRDPSLPEYSTLLPYPDGQVPAVWFDDPAVTWPKR